MNTQTPKEPEKTSESKSFSTKVAILLVLEFGFMIVLPLIIFASAGKWLEQRYDNRLYLFGGLILALLSSSIWVYRKIYQIYQDFTK